MLFAAVLTIQIGVPCSSFDKHCFSQFANIFWNFFCI